MTAADDAAAARSSTPPLTVRVSLAIEPARSTSTQDLRGGVLALYAAALDAFPRALTYELDVDAYPRLDDLDGGP